MTNLLPAERAAPQSDAKRKFPWYDITNIIALAALFAPLGVLQKIGDSPLSVIKIAITLGAVLALPRLGQGRRFIRTPLEYLLLAFVLSFFSSYFQMSISEELPIVQITIAGYLILTSLIVNYCNDRAAIERILFAFLIGCFIAAMIGLAQYKTGLTLIPGLRYSRLYSVGPSLVVLGTAENPNAFAAHFGMAVPLTLAFAITANSFKKKILFLTLTGLFAIIMLLTLSRAAILAAAIAGTIITALALRRRIINKKGVLPTAAAAALAGVLFISQNPEYGFRALFGTSAEFQLQDKIDAITTRKTLYATDLRIMLDHPLVGTGFDMSQQSLANYGFYAEGMNPHNNWLAVATEMGLFGLIPFLGIFVLCFKCCWRLLTRVTTPGDMGLTLGLFGAFISQHLFGLTHTNFVAFEMWLTHALIVAWHLNKVKTKTPAALA